ncbi:MAG: hypothetical protein AB1346_07990 [Thermodesulfobacteriota bacterium]
MGRASTRFGATGFVVLAVAFTMIVSLTGSGGYVFLQEGSGKALSVAVPIPDARHPGESGEDEADPHGTGGITIGLEALGESFAPVFPPPSDGGYVSSSSTSFLRPPDLPGIYRPPIS